MPTIKVLVVDDSVVLRMMLSKVLNADPDIEVIGTAANGSIAVKKLSNLKPDIITLDIEMPVMDGITALKEIRKDYRDLPIIMCSSLTEKGAKSTFEALAAGATDYVTKPANLNNAYEGMDILKEDIIPKIKAFHRRSLIGTKDQVATPAVKAAKPYVRAKPTIKQPLKMLCIGSSTGGPRALEELLSGFKEDFPLPIAIVQHMPTMFTEMLAKRLHDLNKLNVCEASEGDIMKPGHVYIAPGGRHMDLKVNDGEYKIIIHDQPPENSCRPAVDVFFRSAANQIGAHVLAVVLTGMGQDGLRGCEIISEKGGQIVVQDEKSSVVWGMPGSVSNANLAEKVLPLDEICKEIHERVKMYRN